MAYFQNLVARKAPGPTDPRDESEERTEALTGDVAFVYGQGQNGTHILRRRSETSPVEAGVLRPLREGKPIDGEVVSLTPRRDAPLLFDVKSELPDPHPTRAPGEGPVQVASDAYRKGWDAIWGRRRRGGNDSVN